MLNTHTVSGSIPSQGMAQNNRMEGNKILASGRGGCTVKTVAGGSALSWLQANNSSFTHEVNPDGIQQADAQHGLPWSWGAAPTVCLLKTVTHRKQAP